MLFLLSLELSGLKLNLVLYLIFRLLVGVFSFIRFWFAFSFFCCFISQTITDRWHFSASEIMPDFKVFFCFGLYTSVLFVCLSAHWNTSRWRQTGRKKFFVSCLSLATDGQKKTLFSFFWLDNRTFYGIFRA